ncbi:MAG: AMP-binding protein, partial [Burkholderiales bacterium]
MSNTDARIRAAQDQQNSDRYLPRHVERHARERPQAVAVTCDTESLSYAELNVSANRLAWRLKAMGAGPGVRVGLCLPRGPGLIVALLGILKSGAAYVPLDPEYPVKRLRRMVAQARPSIVVTAEVCRERLGNEAPALFLDQVASALLRERIADPADPVSPAQLCYVIFTSGTTGEPKGVMVTHSNVARLFDDMGPRLAVTKSDVWSQIHSSTFGFSVFE